MVDWKQKTWRGRFKLFVLLLPKLLAYAALLLLVGATLAIVGVMYGLVMAMVWVARRWPGTYEAGGVDDV